MNRITPIDPDTATGQTKELFAVVQSELGAVPNVFRVMGNSPAALAGFLNLKGALAEGHLDDQIQEQISLTVSETNLCNYCLSAHSSIGCQIGLSDQDMADARHASSNSPKTDAILKFARSIVVNRGELGDAELQTVRAAGVSEGELVETIANVVANIFTNYLNHVAGTAVDFPEVRTGDLEPIETCSSECGCSH